MKKTLARVTETRFVKVEGVLPFLGIERPGDCEIIGSSPNADGSVTLSIRHFTPATVMEKQADDE